MLIFRHQLNPVIGNHHSLPKDEILNKAYIDGILGFNVK